jgi:hypothetical protein
MLAGSTIQNVATRVTEIRDSARDFLARPSSLLMEIAENTESTMSLSLDGAHSFTLSDIAHDQIAEYAGIPGAYYRRMRAEAPQFLVANANRWMVEGDGRRMVRTATMGGVATARAFLSDRFRPLDNWQLMEAVLPQLSEAGMNIASCELTEKRLYIKAINTRVHGEVRRGQVVQAGVIISNSEVGFGAVDIRPLIYTLACTNGMVLEDASMRRNHVGRKNGGSGMNDENVQHMFSDETRAADDRAFFLKVRDVVKGSLDEVQFRQQVDKLQVAAGLKIESPKLDQVVEITAKRYAMSEDEGAGVLAHLISGGDLTQWGLCSAVTRFAQDVKSYDRSTELERIGGKVVEMDRSEWQRIASAN